MAELVIVSRNELKELVKQVFDEENGKLIKEADFMERMNRKEAAAFLKIGYQTMGIWTRKGWTPMHGKGRKGYYLKSELMNIKPQSL
jgi:hypothetical protein